MKDGEKNGNSLGESIAIDISSFYQLGFAYLLDLNRKFGSFERKEMSRAMAKLVENVSVYERFLFYFFLISLLKLKPLVESEGSTKKICDSKFILSHNLL